MRDSLEAAAYGYAAIEERKRNMKARGLVLAEMAEQEAIIAALRTQNRRLRAALTDIGVNAGGEASRRARAALAAEPASGEGGEAIDVGRERGRLLTMAYDVLRDHGIDDLADEIDAALKDKP